MRRVALFTFALITALPLGAAACEPSVKAAWEKLAPHFEPPKEMANDFGDYESPLAKPEGGEVTSAAEWPTRRLQILRKWRMRLGDWPPPLAKPELRIVKSEHRENFTQHQVVVQVAPPPTQSSPVADAKKSLESHGYLLVPDGEGPFPAVFVPFYEPLTSAGLKPGLKGHHDYGYQLAKRGYLTLSIGTPGGNESGSDTREALVRIGHDYGCQPLGFLAYVASNCHTLLAQRKDVDAKRIGIVGLSYGGKWSMFGSLFDERYACAVWGDPGIDFDESNRNINYYEPWYIGYDFSKPIDGQRPRGVPDDTKPRTGLYKELIEQKQNLVDLMALMAPRPVLVSGGTEDKLERWKALNHLIKVNKLLGHEKRVGLTLRETHVPDEHAAEQTYQFFDVFLKPKREEAKGAAVDPSPGQQSLIAVADATMRDAVGKGLAVLERGAAKYPDNRSCFSCHHQTLPLFAMTAADRIRTLDGGQPFPLKSDLAKSITEFTHSGFSGKHESLREGTGIGGKTLTVGYGMWALDLAGHPRDETTDAMVEYLLKTQEDDGHWNYHSFRPPAASSIAMATALAVYGLEAYGTDEAVKPRVEKALTKAAGWFLKNETQPHQEDRIGVAWGEFLLGNRMRAARTSTTQAGSTPGAEGSGAVARGNAEKETIDILWKSQRADGGWAQEDSMSSDPYATSQALLMVSQTAAPGSDLKANPAYLRGLQYLLNTQRPEGSWHVKTRAKPVQVYFDNGDPHGKDQFLSMMATGWATTVLADALAPGKSPLNVSRRRNAR